MSRVQVINADVVREAVLRSACPDVPRHYRNDYTRQYAAGDDLEQHVGQAVGGVVGVAEAGVADCLGEDQGPPEPDESGREGQACDSCGDRGKTGSHADRLSSVLGLTGTGRRPS